MLTRRTRETLDHLAAAYGSIARSRSQSALALTALAGLSTMSPAAALMCGVAGAAFLVTRPTMARAPLGKVPGRQRVRDWRDAFRRNAKTPAFAVAIDEDGAEVALSPDAMRGNVLVAGASRGDRLDALLSLAEGALANASGIVLVDRSQDGELRQSVWDLARRYGREDDVLHLDLAAARGLSSNGFDPLEHATGDEIVEMLVDLMEAVGGDAMFWRARAIAMLTAVSRFKCSESRATGRRITFRELRDSLEFGAMVGFLDPALHPDAAEEHRDAVRTYLSMLPGYRVDGGGRQPQQTQDQHGYLVMQFSKIMGELIAAFGASGASDVDLVDVVRRRRILLVTGAGTSREGSDADAIKIVLSALKHALARETGGIRGDAVAPVPFLCIQNDVGYYTVPGLAAMAEEARAAGMAMVYASQDMPEMRRLNEREAASIISNTNTRIFMRTEEMDQLHWDMGPDVVGRSRPGAIAEVRLGMDGAALTGLVRRAVGPSAEKAVAANRFVSAPAPNRAMAA